MLWLIIHSDYDGEKHFIRNLEAKLYDDSFTTHDIKIEHCNAHDPNCCNGYFQAIEIDYLQDGWEWP